MENPANNIKSLISNTESYVLTTVQLIKLKSLEKSIKILNVLIFRLILTVMLVSFIFMANFAIAFLLGDLFGKIYLGFLTISGFYVILFLVFYFFLFNRIRKPISEFIISQFYN